MKIMTPAVRLSTGLVLLTISILLIADMLGFVPNPTSSLLDARKRFCEALAVQLSAAAEAQNTSIVEHIMRKVVERNDDVLSAALRREDGLVMAQAGDHQEHWQNVAGERSTSRHVQVPIFDSGSPWGEVEMSFGELFPEGVLGIRARPLVKTLMFVGLSCFVAYLFFMKRTLRYLDPSSVVPQRVQYALDVLAEGVVLLDAKDRIVLANRAFAATVDEPAERLMGRSMEEFRWLEPDDSSEPEVLPWRQVSADGFLHGGTALSLACDGEDRRTFVVKASPIGEAKEKVRGVMVTFDDMTDIEKKNGQLASMVGMLEHAHEELNSKNERLEATNRIIETKVEDRTKALRLAMEEALEATRAKSVFLANISHELRTPMHGILSFAQFGLKKFETAPKEKLKSYFKEIKGSGDRLMSLLNNLLDLSKLRAGGMTYDLQKTSMSDVLESVLKEFAAYVEQRGLTVEVASACQDSTAIFDSYRISQVVRNLLANAVKFSGAGTTISVTLAEATVKVGSRNAEALMVSVADEGVGIPQDELKKIFDPFSQSGRTASGAGGTGLGLAICKEIVEAHHGWIVATNRPEGGALMTFAIPKRPVGVPAQVVETA